MRWLVVLVGLGACGSDRANDGYEGVSATRPTGSPRIAHDGLVLAMDMTSRHTDGSLRDVGPLGLRGAVTTHADVQGALGLARMFTSVEDRVDLPEHPALAIDGPITVAAWVRVDRIGIHQHVIACDDKFVLWIPPNNRWRFVDTLGHGAQSTTPVVPILWHSVVAVFTGTKGTELSPGTIQIYIDGSAVPLEPVNRANDVPLRWAPGPLYPSDACYIGYESHQGDAEHKAMPFVGAIDDLVVFSRAWTSEEISAHANRR